MYFMNDTILRLWGIFKKELIVIRRDYGTYIFILIAPFAQVILFGLIINTDAKNIPTVVVMNDNSPFTDSIIQSFRNTGYFAIKTVLHDEKRAEELMAKGETQFIIHIPQGFSRDLVRNKQPHILLEGDASDPVLVNNAFNAASIVIDSALKRDTVGPLKYLEAKKNNFIVDTHARYNQAIKAQYHTLPGLLVSILIISLCMIMAISITSEVEAGTMEMLLVTPIKPLEVIIGKLLPNILLGYVLFYAILIIIRWFFHVPFYGSVLLLSVSAFPFIIANLGIGIATSCIAKTQFQAANIVGTYSLPAILFSGFMFPIAAMPIWAQWISYLLPGTYFLKISSDIMLKNAGFIDVWPNLWPMLIFAGVIIYISYKFYRETLD